MLSSAAEAALVVRAALKTAFPGARFSVRQFCGDVEIRWSDGPKPDAVTAATSRLDTGHTGIIPTRTFSPAVLDRATVLWVKASGLRPDTRGFVPAVRVDGVYLIEGTALSQINIVAERVLARRTSAREAA
jgi:Large polyvalent protein associated domain 29